MSTPHELYDAAVALHQTGDTETAVTKLQEILESAPDHFDTHAALAVYLQKLGRNDEAIEHSKKVCDLKPEDIFSYSQLSMICMRAGRIQEAEDAKAKATIIRMGGQVKPQGS
ncbi:MAG: tetratricopeptide repeat protein [Planctomycetaceae bacterium]|nr:tetratricopeptide repeat protein [Planctomycetaceae bacterium]MCB9953883.1 tetratricopeptide repeat protein [Planctomycetaceae bacterium]